MHTYTLFTLPAHLHISQQNIVAELIVFRFNSLTKPPTVPLTTRALTFAHQDRVDASVCVFLINSSAADNNAVADKC